jgi:hypothetical protein
MVRFEIGLLPRFAPNITDSNSDLFKASISSFRPGSGGLAATAGGVDLPDLLLSLPEPLPDLAALVTTAERGSMPFSTTASITDNMTISIVTTLFMSSDASGLSRIGFTLLARAVAVTSTSLIEIGSKVGFGGGLLLR